MWARHKGTHGRQLQTQAVVVSCCIAFLSGHGSLQVGLDAVDYFLILSDKAGAKDCPLDKLNPVQGCTASAAIQFFERCHRETLLITIVVRELM
jgi:hypothetical protein